MAVLKQVAGDPASTLVDLKRDMMVIGCVPKATTHEVREFAGHADIRATELHFVLKDEESEVAARRIQILVTLRKGEWDEHRSACGRSMDSTNPHKMCVIMVGRARHTRFSRIPGLRTARETLIAKRESARRDADVAELASLRE